MADDYDAIELEWFGPDYKSMPTSDKLRKIMDPLSTDPAMYECFERGLEAMIKEGALDEQNEILGHFLKAMAAMPEALNAAREAKAMELKEKMHNYESLEREYFGPNYKSISPHDKLSRILDELPLDSIQYRMIKEGSGKLSPEEALRITHNFLSVFKELPGVLDEIDSILNKLEQEDKFPKK